MTHGYVLIVMTGLYFNLFTKEIYAKKTKDKLAKKYKQDEDKNYI